MLDQAKQALGSQMSLLLHKEKFKASNHALPAIHYFLGQCTELVSLLIT